MEPDRDQVRHFAQRLIRQASYHLKQRREFATDDVEDLEQSFQVKLESALGRLRSDDNWRGCVATLISNYARNLLRFKRARKRAGPVLSLNAVDIAKGESELSQSISQQEHDAWRGKTPRSDTELTDLCSDVHSVIAGLPSKDAALAEQLMLRTPAEICREAGVAPSTLATSIRRLRSIFEDKGLKNYL